VPHLTSTSPSPIAIAAALLFQERKRCREKKPEIAKEEVGLKRKKTKTE
jgi:hypothetical protein